ncbi:MAG TPA: hypothetical protein VLF42_02505 [Burkholderiales bacterium]|nr:hypothetical protein [Burkholderiales bacterium]
MEWLLQNWIWIVVAVGGVWFLSRMRPGGMTQDTAAKAAGDKDATSHRHSGCC